MESAFLLQHLHVLPDGSEDLKVIGIYASMESAMSAIERLKSQPGFSDFPDLIDPSTDSEPSGFYIDKYILNQDHWSEGFISS